MSENKNELARKLGLGAVIALGVGTYFLVIHPIANAVHHTITYKCSNK